MIKLVEYISVKEVQLKRRKILYFKGKMVYVNAEANMLLWVLVAFWPVLQGGPNDGDILNDSNLALNKQGEELFPN